MSDELIPKRLARETFYKSAWFSLHLDRVQFPGGYIVEKYQMMETAREVVACVVEDAEGRILMVRVPRYPTQRLEWEIPGGGIDPGESVLDAARRELAEETGYELEDLRAIYAFHPVNGHSNETFHVARARAGRRLREGTDECEIAEVRWFSREELLRMIAARELMDSMTVVGLLLVMGNFSEGE